MFERTRTHTTHFRQKNATATKLCKIILHCRKHYCTCLSHFLYFRRANCTRVYTRLLLLLLLLRPTTTTATKGISSRTLFREQTITTMRERCPKGNGIEGGRRSRGQVGSKRCTLTVERSFDSNGTGTALTAVVLLCLFYIALRWRSENC